MESIESFQFLWFLLIAALFLGYSLLDGFDLGIAALLPVLGKSKEEKDALIGSIGPVWDGNEVWLITGGGALFAAFPHAYATMFSGFYLGAMIILFALIFRAVSMEFRAHDSRRAGLWEAALTGGSLIVIVCFGLLLGSLVYGVPLAADMEFAGTFFNLFRPVPLIFGLTGLAAVLLQGAAYAIAKTEFSLQDRAFKVAGILTALNAGTAVVFFATLAFVFKGAILNPVFFAGAACVLLGIAGARTFVRKRSEKAVFGASSLSIAGLWLATGAVHFPNLIKAINDPGLSITIYNASTGLHTLKLLTAIAFLFLPVVIAYSWFVYRIFKGKVKTAGY